MEGERKSARRTREAAERKKIKEPLERRGWKSTGDVPFELAHELGKTQGSIQGQLWYFIERALEGQGEQYRLDNLKEIDKKKTFISPDLIGRIKKQATLFYSDENLRRARREERRKRESQE